MRRLPYPNGRMRVQTLIALTLAGMPIIILSILGIILSDQPIIDDDLRQEKK